MLVLPATLPLVTAYVALPLLVALVGSRFILSWINKGKPINCCKGEGGEKWLVIARQEDSSVMLSRSEASLCPVGETLRCGSG
jgi:hypothetical protein